MLTLRRQDSIALSMFATFSPSGVRLTNILNGFTFSRVSTTSPASTSSSTLAWTVDVPLAMLLARSPFIMAPFSFRIIRIFTAWVFSSMLALYSTPMLTITTLGDLWLSI